MGYPQRRVHFNRQEELSRHTTTVEPTDRSSNRDYLDGFGKVLLKKSTFLNDKEYSRTEKNNETTPFIEYPCGHEIDANSQQPYSQLE